MHSTDLVPVFTGELNGQTVQFVDARDLHHFLESGHEFVNWFKERIEQYGFEEGIDFLSISSKNKNQGRGRPRTDYHVTLDTAKEPAMVERNAKGRQARRYFIDCERRLRETAQSRAQNLLTDELQSAINQEAHTLVLRSFGPIRAALSELARQHLERSDSESHPG
ncbi:antA/AntB antirepressor family protein [Methylomagnum ishizawai]|uniref:antA/AntB antirepressor family protein n=1 Tax=Methylomagnum ishizawai TaxID=1760988 RepID=UPI001C330594|nr:antA/AntB antirepressor family protein [Methylomagnum ishizawai]BBL77395.1 hypothetical protein MishRS11D_44930 [Methylomagnum ishizawai]